MRPYEIILIFIYTIIATSFHFGLCALESLVIPNLNLSLSNKTLAFNNYSSFVKHQFKVNHSTASGNSSRKHLQKPLRTNKSIGNVNAIGIAIVILLALIALILIMLVKN
jgi:hypothetical protein